LTLQPAPVTCLHSTSLVSLSEVDRAAILNRLTNEQASALLYDWPFWAREKQLLPEGEWQTWLFLAGRGYGKTRLGSETVRVWARKFQYVNLVGATADDARDIMIEGESGILAVCPPAERPEYQPSKRQLAWPNGGKSLIFTADEPERLRGKQHCKLWCDELAAWRYPESWDQAQFGLRLGSAPQSVVTTTPRPTKLVRELIANPTTHVTRGSTYENRANLAQAFFDKIIRKYEGTRLGRQELMAELLEDNPGALWRRADIERDRVSEAPLLQRVVVAVDPAGSSSEEAADTGIVVAGVDPAGVGYVLDDMSVHDSPHVWGTQACAALSKYRGDRIVGENNFGGEMVEFTIRAVNRNVSYKNVHASRGKIIRAEPVSSLYEQGRVHHVGTFSELEDQLCQWEPGMKSPDRLDALVWALTELMVTDVPHKTGATRVAR
jgi:phage terminase large subunit-like protein